MTIEQLLPGIQKDVLLKNYTTFKIGGPAKYFFVAKNKEDLISAIKVAKKFNLPFFILGGGSNVLVADGGYDGVVIKMENGKLKIKNYNKKFKIICGAGYLLRNLVSKSLEFGATGLEWAAGIPGTVGGAIYGNAGAFGSSMADLVKSVEVFDITESRIINYELGDCKFGYRDSIFKRKKNLVILSVEFQLKKGNKKEIRNKMKECLDYRKKNHPLEFSSAGSIFKNPPKCSAAELIEKCGLKGKRIGNVKISEKHANFIINLGNGRAKDVRKLINLAKKRVKNKFGIKLKEEIQYLGFKN